MVKIPDRFLGFSFSVGDILIEVDDNFKILNADGAINDLGLKNNSAKGTSFLDLLSEDEKKIFKQISSPLKQSNRIGPVYFRIGTSLKFKKKFAIFMGMPLDDNKRIFLVLMSSYRLGALSEDVEKAYDKAFEKENFLEKISNILMENKNQDKNLNITLIETPKTENSDTNSLDELGSLLNKYSTGGNMAGRLSDNHFAVLHTKQPEGLSINEIISEISNATNLELKTTSIDADQDMLSEEDGIRALIFSLRQFAEEADGFDVDSLATGYEQMVRETAEKVKHLRSILKNGDFTLFYQPIVSLKTKKIHHCEALIRFNDPKLHNLQFETICFAEDVGLILDFDKAIFERTVEKIDQIKSNVDKPRLAVNLSGRSLSNKGFLNNLLSRLKNNIHLNDYISLEITESSEIKNIEQLSHVINAVRELGFKVYLDDFGAGAAGFRYLRELAVDGVKIDGEYIRGALFDKKVRAFLRSIVMLCNDLEIETIAEWVETDEQEEFLISLGVTYGQGYLYGRPNASIKY